MAPNSSDILFVTSEKKHLWFRTIHLTKAVLQIKIILFLPSRSQVQGCGGSSEPDHYYSIRVDSFLRNPVPLPISTRHRQIKCSHTLGYHYHIGQSRAACTLPCHFSAILPENLVLSMQTFKQWKPIACF